MTRGRFVDGASRLFGSTFVGSNRRAIVAELLSEKRRPPLKQRPSRLGLGRRCSRMVRDNERDHCSPTTARAWSRRRQSATTRRTSSTRDPSVTTSLRCRRSLRGRGRQGKSGHPKVAAKLLAWRPGEPLHTQTPACPSSLSLSLCSAGRPPAHPLSLPPDGPPRRRLWRSGGSGKSDAKSERMGGEGCPRPSGNTELAMSNNCDSRFGPEPSRGPGLRAGPKMGRARSPLAQDLGWI